MEAKDIIYGISDRNTVLLVINNGFAGKVLFSHHYHTAMFKYLIIIMRYILGRWHHIYDVLLPYPTGDINGENNACTDRSYGGRY